MLNSSKKRTHEDVTGRNEPPEKKQRLDTPDLTDIIRSLETQVRTFIASEIELEYNKQCWEIEFQPDQCCATAIFYFLAQPFFYEQGVAMTKEQVVSTITDYDLMCGVTQIYDYDDEWDSTQIQDPVYYDETGEYQLEIKAVVSKFDEPIFPQNIIASVQHLVQKIIKRAQKHESKRAFQVNLLDDDRLWELNLIHYRAIFNNELFKSEMKHFGKETYPNLKVLVHKLSLTAINNVQSIQVSF